MLLLKVPELNKMYALTQKTWRSYGVLPTLNDYTKHICHCKPKIYFLCCPKWKYIEVVKFVRIA